MDKQELLKHLYIKQMEVKSALRMYSYLMNNGVKVPERELDKLLDRYSELMKLIKELED